MGLGQQSAAARPRRSISFESCGISRGEVYPLSVAAERTQVAAVSLLLAVRVLEDESTYNTVEDVTGRMLSLREGDVLAGTLGTRRAFRSRAAER